MIYKWDVPSIQCEETIYNNIYTVIVGYYLTIVDIITNLIFWLTLPTYMHLNIPYPTSKFETTGN
jgi:hypothetical protein